MKWTNVLGVSIVSSSLMLAGCNTEQVNKESHKEQTQAQAESPVTISNYHREFTIEEPPKRVISTNNHTTELLLALGLEDVIVGKVIGHESDILPEFQEAFDVIPTISQSDHHYPSLEAILEYEPDFMFGRESAFTENSIGTPEKLKEYGINVLVSKGTYTPGATIEDVYEDIENLGKIFNVEERGEEIINEMKANIESVQKQIGKIEEPVSVAVMDMGGDSLFTAAQALESNLIELAGGRNVFADIEKTWAKVSWEELVERNPDVIVINEYSEVPTEDKINELLTHSALQDVEAVKNQRFVILSLSNVFEGVRNDDAVEILAKGFYPEKFGE
ncbi:ABC transporter substrate-binding protein [Aeribacillus pallidus]|uniref:ABC transporter substrate-binding protein n=1 Tax=Aeribacillus pallidus TaxID=33936 RepID=UPI003D1BF4B3